MFSRHFISTAILIAATTSWAQASKLSPSSTNTKSLVQSLTPDSPVDTDIQQKGYKQFPVLQCPATNEAMKQFRKKLMDLKKAIKSEANCSGISADVKDLSTLVTKQREDVVSLISKGQTEGLTSAEQGKVESYVQQVTEKSSNLLAVITGNDACFAEDKKGMSMEFITGLIGESTKVLSILGGPQVGATVQIAGEVINGFLKAMKTIQDTRQGYKFAQADQRIAYADSLCSLFDYRRELDNLIAPYESMNRLQQLKGTLEKQLSILANDCPECAEIITTVHNEIKTSRDASNGAPASVDSIWPKAFEQKIAARATEIDKLYTRRVGTHTYRSLRTLTWIPIRMEALKDSNLKADLGLEDVISQMKSIEDFMVDDQGPSFEKQLIREAREWQQKLVSHVTKANYTLRMLQSSYPNLQLPKIPWASDLPEYYGALLDAMDAAREQINGNDQSLVRTFFADLDSLTRSLNIATEVAGNYCSFFGAANWYRPALRYQCDSAQMKAIQEASAMFTNYRALMPSHKSSLAIPAKDEHRMSAAIPAKNNYAVDWVDSLTQTVDSMTESGDYVRRNQQPPVLNLAPE
ncbi:MAG: hypothetical protein H6623_09125 [Bdellovibrionaceae bacterium]|nr:hypothetical protein [Pseudobdellovibrionaceae bacterium]